MKFIEDSSSLIHSHDDFGVCLLRFNKTISQSNKQPYSASATKATIRGTVTLIGKHSANRRIDESADSVCASLDPAARTESVVGRQGRLANVFCLYQEWQGAGRLFLCGQGLVSCSTREAAASCHTCSHADESDA